MLLNFNKILYEEAEKENQEEEQYQKERKAPTPSFLDTTAGRIAQQQIVGHAINRGVGVIGNVTTASGRAIGRALANRGGIGAIVKNAIMRKG